MRTVRHLMFLSILSAATTSASAQTIHYVKADATGARDGSSWADAYTSLQDGLAAASPGHQVWVAAGVYHPDQGAGLTPGSRSLSFEMKSGVRLHGGFGGTETSKAGRNLGANRTILSGDLAGDDDGLALREDNSYHVVRATDVDETALLEGFVIVNGQADGAGADSLGGGILIQGGAPWIINTRVNSSVAGCGGGIAVTAEASPSLVNTVIHGNRAAAGGGICNLDSSPEVVNATISENLAGVAAGVYNLRSYPTLVNAIVSNNQLVSEANHCEYWQYPCSLMDVTPDVLSETMEIMEAAAGATVNGAMEDALEYVRNHPKVVQYTADSLALAARVRGGFMALLSDKRTSFSVVASGKRDLAASAHEGSGQTRPQFPVAAAAGADLHASLTPAQNRGVVGDDLNRDGKIDNRDGKRALIISPFNTADTWEINELLLGTADYSGKFSGETQASSGSRGVQVLGDFTSVYYSPDAQTDSLAAALQILNVWASFDDYDFVYLATEDVSVPVRNLSHWAVSTGIPHEVADLLLSTKDQLSGDENQALKAMTLSWVVFPSGLRRSLSLYSDFFTQLYESKLTNAMVLCGYCNRLDIDFGGVSGSNYTVGRWVGGTIFDLLSDLAFSEINVRYVEKLILGLNDYWIIENQMVTVTIGEGSLVLLRRRGGAILRIVELPTLYYNPTKDEFGEPKRYGFFTPLVDGTDITELIHGGASSLGDSFADHLYMQTRVAGVTPETKGDFRVRYVVQGVETTQTLNRLDSFFEVPGSEGALVEDAIFENLGFTLGRGFLPIEVIVDVPNGGESRYSVVAAVDAYSCTARTSVRGNQNGDFTGAANWLGNEQAGYKLFIESATGVLSRPIPEKAQGPGHYEVQFWLGPGQQSPPERGVNFEILSGFVASPQLGDIWGFTYDALEDNSDCPECGGSVRVDSTSSDSTTWYGSFDFVGREGSGDYLKTTTAEGSFRAVTGVEQEVSSPYFKCLSEYWVLAHL